MTQLRCPTGQNEPGAITCSLKNSPAITGGLEMV